MAGTLEASRKNIRRTWVILIILGMSALGLTASAQQPPPATLTSANVGSSSLDQPLAWLTEARRNYTAVRDYSCILQKRERIRGVLQDENIILLSSRTQPYSVYMKWLAPHKFRGQEVCFVQGRNNGMMRVQSKGLLGGITGFVNVRPDDRRVVDHSRHNIYEAGLGNLIDQCLHSFEIERRLNKTQVRTAEFKCNNRLCVRVETIRPERNENFYCYRSFLYLDKESKLPIRMDNYDWPYQGGSSDGELLETFSYLDLRFNVGLTDDLFRK